MDGGNGYCTPTEADIFGGTASVTECSPGADSVSLSAYPFSVLMKDDMIKEFEPPISVLTD